MVWGRAPRTSLVRAGCTWAGSWTLPRAARGVCPDEYHDTHLAYGALTLAVAVRGGKVPVVVFHSDSEDLPGSASANPWPTELPGQRGHRVRHSALVRELRSPWTFTTQAEARTAVSPWIEDCDDLRRCMKSPADYERSLTEHRRRVSATSPREGKGGSCTPAIRVARHRPRHLLHSDIWRH